MAGQDGIPVRLGAQVGTARAARGVRIVRWQTAALPVGVDPQAPQRRLTQTLRTLLFTRAPPESGERPGASAGSQH